MRLTNVSKCERLAAETGCWLYISAQHVNANSGFYSYSSPRVRRDAREEVTEIQNCCNVMYASLLGARRSDAVALSLQAEKTKAELQKAQEQIAAQRAEIAQLRSDLRQRQLSVTSDSDQIVVVL